MTDVLSLQIITCCKLHQPIPGVTGKSFNRQELSVKRNKSARKYTSTGK